MIRLVLVTFAIVIGTVLITGLYDVPPGNCAGMCKTYK